MARKGGSKEGFSHDPSISMPSEQRTSESNKQKISRIHETFPNATKDHIARILQFYDDDENKAIDAITRDGGCEALSHLAETGNLKNKNNKSKKKKKKQKKDTLSGITATASFDADDSSSIHSSGNVDADIEKDFQRVENGNGFLPDNASELDSINSILNHERLQDTDVEPVSLIARSAASTPEDEIIQSVPSRNLDKFGEQCAYEKSISPSRKQQSENTPRASPLSDNSEKQEEHEQKKDKVKTDYRYTSRQRTNSFRRSKTSSLSEDSSSQHNTQNLAAKRGIDRCKKDLSRQTISLQRIHSQVEKNLEESAKKVKIVFAEISKQFENRMKEIELELEKSKADALNLVKSRQELAVELKRRVDRSPSMTDSEWNELRSDIKLFVTERKYDEDLSKTIWFQWPDISDTIKSFGEVQPVKNVYSQRSNSVLANSEASQSNNPEPSPSSSLANEEIDYAADKNDVAVISDTVEDETLSTVKEEASNVNKNRPHEVRTFDRVFSSSRKRYPRFNNRFQNNRGYHGRGGGYQRPYNRNYSNYNNRYDDYRNHPPHQERDGRVNENQSYSGNDRNMNYYRDKNDRGRGQQHPNTRYQYHRYNRDQSYRSNVDNTAPTTTESSAKSAEPTAGKSTVINGVENN